MVAVVLGLVGYGLISGEKPASAGVPASGAENPRRDRGRAAAVERKRALETSAPGLEGALAEQNPARRAALLRQWAASVDAALMEETMARILQTRDAESRKEICHALLAIWIERDMDGVAGWFGREGSYEEIEMRMEARGFLLEAMARREPEQALAWLEQSLSKRARDLLYEPFFLQWAGTDPAAACAKLHQLADGRLLGDAAARWAARDLTGAVAWVKSLPEGPLQSQAMLEVSYRWTAASPMEAATYAAQTGNPELLRAVVGMWADQSPETAAAWVAEWPPGEAHDRALAHLANIWSQKDPAAAAAYTGSLPAGADRDQAMVAVASVWAYSSPRQAAEWIRQLPEGAAREQALQRLITAWAGAKPEEAAKWLGTLPDGGSTDFAIRAYSNTLVQASPEQAFQWANTISGEAARQQQLERVAASWILQDEAAARVAITGSNLPENTKARLLAGPPVLLDGFGE